jgi:hypothetical protein
MTTDPLLMTAFAFDAQDVEANRRGRFSRAQRGRVFGHALSGVPIFGGISLGAAVIIGIAVGGSVLQIAAFFLLLAGALTFLLFVLSALFLIGLSTAQGVITLSVQGEVDVSAMVRVWLPSAAGTYYRLDVGADYFYLPYEQYDALKRYEGRACTVYFFYRDPKWQREILSLEIV